MRPLSVFVPAAVAALAVTAPIASAAIPSTDGTIHGCYASNILQQGNLRVVTDGSGCRVGEVAIVWNATGPAGATGAQGATGATGAAGATGATGAAGAAGATGATGRDGAAGATGATGAAGHDGAAGATGLQGVAGAVGAAGATGATGVQGVAGAAGRDGRDGAAGAAGATGATGSPGVAGPAGATGLQGVAGTAGAAGATGVQGVAGPAGTNGTNGLNGVAGPQGPKGDQGPAGPAGPAGAAEAITLGGEALSGGTADAYLTIPGVTGESQASGHVGAIELKSFGYEFKNALTIGSAGTGAGAGKASFEAAHITKFVDSSTPAFIKELTTGGHWTDAEIDFVKNGPDGKPFTFETIKFKLVFVSDYRQGGTAEPESLENIDLQFGSFLVTYTPQNSAGAPLNPINFGWDQTQNKEVTP